jgi:hypothetical protein
MTAADQLRSDLLDALERMKLAHHALADGQHSAALVHIDVAAAQLGDLRARLAPLAARVPVAVSPSSTL